MATFADTNVFIHFLIGFDPDRHQRCYELFQAVEEGKTELETSDMVIAELAWFLERPPIRMNAAGVRDKLAPLCSLPGLRLPDKELLMQTLKLHAESALNFVDAYNAVVMRKRGLDRIYSYDTDFDGVPGVTRVAP